MSAEQTPSAPARPSARRRRFLWDGALPEVFGLCLVGIILGGFVTAYFAANYLWRAHSRSVQGAETETIAQAWAATIGALAATDGPGAETLLKSVSCVPHVRAVQWTGPDGTTRFSWPRPEAGIVAPMAPSTMLPLVAQVPVPGGGTLRIERGAAADSGYTSTLLCNWGLAAGATLLAIGGVYHYLRRHLRPVAAIERNLRSYAGGLERELLTLTLSGSLGEVAEGWNSLIGELAELKRQLQEAQSAGAHDVLARFEGALFRRIIDRLPFGVLNVGESQNITYANAAAAALLQVPLEKLTGRPAGEVLEHPSVQQALAAGTGRSAAGVLVDHARPEGEHETTLRYRVLPLAGPAGGRDTLVTVEDISQLREGQKARDNFLYHVTHELRTPLTNIHAYAETLTRPDFDDEQTRKECYNVLISETERLSRLVEDILSISQLEVGTARLNVGEVDLAKLVRQMVQDNLGKADAKKIDLTLTLPPKVPKIQGDKQRLSVLLSNLIGNAVKYTPEQGKVHVLVEAGPRNVQVAVSDTGIGIGAEDQAHVFDKFYRAASEEVQMSPGTGLGLALAREVARLHGGEIHLQSELGKGSTFTVVLPLAGLEPAEVTTS